MSKDKNLQELLKSYKESKKISTFAEQALKDMYSKKWKLEGDNSTIHVVDSNFISVRCESFEDFKSILKNSDPYETSHKVLYGSKTHYIKSPYLFTIKNNFHDRELRFEFKKLSPIKIWVQIDFNLIPEDFIDVFFVETTRKLYTDTESHYLDGLHSKPEDVRVKSYAFNGEYVTWYGGDHTILDCAEFHEMLNVLNK